MTRKFKVGDRVAAKWSGEQYTLLRHCDYEPTAWWIKSAGKEECWCSEFELTFISPQTFTLDVTFTSVDDAAAAATILAKHLNQPVPVIHV